jgi:hypothetical protein
MKSSIHSQKLKKDIYQHATNIHDREKRKFLPAALYMYFEKVISMDTYITVKLELLTCYGKLKQ